MRGADWGKMRVLRDLKKDMIGTQAVLESRGEVQGAFARGKREGKKVGSSVDGRAIAAWESGVPWAC
jgi:hypothetical protein